MPIVSALSKAADSGVNGPIDQRIQCRSLVVGVCLFALLIYCTATIFVRAVWALQSFQIGIFALLAAFLLTGFGKDDQGVSKEVASLLIYIIPVWGIIQILAHTTVSTFETRKAVLRWGALAAVFFLTQIVTRTPRIRKIALQCYLCFATAMAVLCLTQLFTSDGLVLWVFPTGYPDVYATFPSYNNFAQFIELALPVPIWFALREGWRSWGYVLVGGVLYASVIGSASRAGAVLCTSELLALLVIHVVQQRRSNRTMRARSATAFVALMPLIAIAFTAVVGWQRVSMRFHQNDPYLMRWELLIPAIKMAKSRPMLGYGLGTFPEVYPQHAIVEISAFVNHAHNDWAEFAADGGIPFLLLIFIPFAVAVPAVIRHPWALGLVAVMLHACVDFPFPRPAVSGWVFAMLGLLYMARAAERNKVGSLDADSSHPTVVLEFRQRRNIQS